MTLTVLAVLLLAAATVVAPGAAAAPAMAACPAGSDGVTVVVDFGNLAGGVQIRCVTNPSSGFDALKKAGFTYSGTQRFPGLLCRIDEQPADDPCVNAPPADRYWAYWTADAPGGAWTYSDMGAGNRTPPPGSVEGWAFSDGCTRAPQGPACPSSTTTTRRPSTTTTTAPSDGGGSTTDGSGTTGGSSTTVEAAPTTSIGAGSASTTTEDLPAGGRAPEPGEAGDVALASGTTGGSAGGGGGSPTGTLLGVGAAVVLLGATAGTIRRRRDTEESPP